MNRNKCPFVQTSGALFCLIRHATCVTKLVILTFPVTLGTVGLWRGLWKLLDVYVFKNDNLEGDSRSFISEDKESDWLCYAVGLFILVSADTLGLLVTRSALKLCRCVDCGPLVLGVLHRAFILYVLIGVVSVWRGLWYVWDSLTVDDWSSVREVGRSALISHVLGVLLLLWPNKLASVTAPPVVNAYDTIPDNVCSAFSIEWCHIFRRVFLGNEGVNEEKEKSKTGKESHVHTKGKESQNPLNVCRTRLSTISASCLYFLLKLLDVGFASLYLAAGVVSFWRGSWVLMDVYVFSIIEREDNKLKSGIVSLSAACAALIVAHIVRWFFAVIMKPVVRCCVCVATRYKATTLEASDLENKRTQEQRNKGHDTARNIQRDLYGVDQEKGEGEDGLVWCFALCTDNEPCVTGGEETASKRDAKNESQAHSRTHQEKAETLTSVGSFAHSTATDRGSDPNIIVRNVASIAVCMARVLRCAVAAITNQFLSYILGWITVSAWRGVWFLMDEMLFPEDPAASALAGMVIGAPLSLAFLSLKGSLACPATVSSHWALETWNASAVGIRCGIGVEKRQHSCLHCYDDKCERQVEMAKIEQKDQRQFDSTSEEPTRSTAYSSSEWNE